MAFGARGPKLTTAEREALARFRERRKAGGAPATLTHVAPHTPVEPAPTPHNGSSRDLRTARDLRAQRDVARARRERERQRVKVPVQLEASSCGLGAFLGRPHSNETKAAPASTRTAAPKHRQDRSLDEATGDGMRARMFELAGRFKHLIEGDAQAPGVSRENNGGAKGLGSFAVRRPSIFKTRKKAGDRDESMCNSDEDEDRQQQRNDDAYFHDLMVDDRS